MMWSNVMNLLYRWETRGQGPEKQSSEQSQAAIHQQAQPASRQRQTHQDFTQVSDAKASLMLCLTTNLHAKPLKTR